MNLKELKDYCYNHRRSLYGKNLLSGAKDKITDYCCRGGKNRCKFIGPQCCISDKFLGNQWVFPYDEEYTGTGYLRYLIERGGTNEETGRS